MTEQQVQQAIKPADVEAGDVMAFVYYATVKRSDNRGINLTVTDLDRGNDFTVNGHELVAAAFSADQYVEEKKITQSDLIDILMQSYHVPFTVCFDKDDGKERTLRGRLIRPDHRRGRSHVEDLDIKDSDKRGGRDRQVNHRGLKWMIVQGVKYTAK